jgi:hypothetical protein
MLLGMGTGRHQGRVQTASSPYRTSHTSGRPPPGLQLPDPPLKTKHVEPMSTAGSLGFPRLIFPPL